MTGTELATFTTELNGGASIGDTLLYQLVNLAKGIVEQRRPWMLLRNTDTSKSVTTAGTWQTAIDLSTISRFDRFYGEYPIKLFNGAQTVHEYRQVPFDQRLNYILDPDTFIYDEGNQDLYLNGTPPFAGSLYIDHIKLTADIAAGDTSAWIFPSWAHPILGYMAVAMHKGGVDYDDINARMAPENQMRADQIMKMLERWDGEKQLTAQAHTDPYGGSGGFRPGAIDMTV